MTATDLASDAPDAPVEEDRIAAAIRPGLIVFVSWSVSARTQSIVCAYCRAAWECMPKVLRLYSAKGKAYRDFPLPFSITGAAADNVKAGAAAVAGGERRSCSLGPLQPGCTYVAVYGIVTAGRQFVPIVHSAPFRLSGSRVWPRYSRTKSIVRWLPFKPCETEPEQAVRQRAASGEYKTDYPYFSAYTVYALPRSAPEASGGQAAGRITLSAPALSPEAFERPPEWSRSKRLLLPAKASPEGQAQGRLTVLMLTWEYAPCASGQARAVSGLARHLAMLGHAVHVVTRKLPGSAAYEEAGDVHVHRVGLPVSSECFGFADWVLAVNVGLARRAAQLLQYGIVPDVLHAHDGLVHPAAAELSRSAGLPLAVTMHSTEIGRRRGQLPSELHSGILRQERQLCADAQRIIVCSRAMASELRCHFHVPADKMAFIPNGIDPAARSEDRDDRAHVRENLIVYIGRLVYEKGVHVLIEAMQHILHCVPDARLIVAGTGPFREKLERQAAPYGEGIRFAGRVKEKEREKLLARAGVCVVPTCTNRSASSLSKR
nr:glycosyltransferase family 4 protein [Paenibacillus sp. VKM B-2647]